jgi:hypothetical protein
VLTSKVLPERSRVARLVAIKTIHSVVWTFFAGCITAIPVLALLNRSRDAAILIVVTLVEVVVLLVNRWSCPLTPIAAHYTDDRRANFDIYLPEWLARNNKRIFGTLYVGGILLTLALWYLRQTK